MILTNAMTYEGECSGDDGTDYYFADFIDGSDEPLAHVVSIPKTFEAYEPITEDGVSHCCELDRAEALDRFLDQIAGKYQIKVSAFAEICVSGWWANVQSISFSDATDAALFVLRFGK